MNNTGSDSMIHLDNISKSFIKSNAQPFLALSNIQLHIEEGEIVTLLGQSGSGKSTLLRIISGLLQPSSGTAYFCGKPITEPVEGISMVFQSFALLPWLTVLGNVELGLEAKGMGRTQRRHLALQAIDTIGLDGYESAYPKELSGGMQQRVGIARALVTEPALLILDEAFSALDILTAENLRSDIMDLWFAKQTGTRSILQVSHNIEEAVMTADRIVLFDSNPGRIKTELKVRLKQPRHVQDPAVQTLIDDVYLKMTDKPKRTALPMGVGQPALEERTIALAYRLPDAEESEITGLIEAIALNYAYRSCELSELADNLHLNINALLSLLEILEILRFAFVEDGYVTPTKAGIRFAEADILEKKKIFANHLLAHVTLARYIRSELDAAEQHSLPHTFFLEKLEETLDEQEAERVLKAVINWGRYAELFAFEYNGGQLSLENPR